MLARLLTEDAGELGGSYRVNDFVDRGDGLTLVEVIATVDPHQEQYENTRTLPHLGIVVEMQITLLLTQHELLGSDSSRQARLCSRRCLLASKNADSSSDASQDKSRSSPGSTTVAKRVSQAACSSKLYTMTTLADLIVRGSERQKFDARDT